MTRLPLVVDLHADETPASFVSRLGSLNGTGAHALCRDARLAFQNVVDGDADTLRAVAAMGLADPDALLANAFVRTARLRWDWRGHDLHRDALRGRRVTVCPACVTADIAARPDLPPPAAAYGRILWRIGAVRTCLVHKVPLVPTGTGHGALHDYAYHIAMVLPRLAKLADATPQEPTAFETYVAARLDGLKASPLLDPMPLDQAVRLVETAGAVEQWGPKVNLNTLTDAARRIAGARGFEAIATGPEAFADLLKRLQGKRSRHRQDGAGAVFGPLNYLLYATRERAEYGQVQDVARTYVAENFVVEPQAGKAPQPRRLHSIHTLAKASGIHPKPLRKRLRAAGLVTETQMANSDHNVRIDAAAAEKVAQETTGLLSRAAAMKHIGAPRSQMDVLIAFGLLTPRWELSTFGGRDGYAATDLDAFLGSLAANAEPARKTGKGFCSIPAAARQACRSATEVVRLILDGKLATRTLPGPRSYMRILVDVNAVKNALRGPQPQGLSLRLAAREIGTSDRALETLIKFGHIKATTEINPVNRCPQTLVPNTEIAAFRQAYVSLWALSKECGVYIATLKRRLDRAGVKPAFDLVKIGARFYARAPTLDAAVRAE